MLKWNVADHETLIWLKPGCVLWRIDDDTIVDFERIQFINILRLLNFLEQIASRLIAFGITVKGVGCRNSLAKTAVLHRHAKIRFGDTLLVNKRVFP